MIWVKAIDDLLERLGMDYMDLYLIHQLFGDIFGSWRAVIEAYKAGKLRAIETANFQPDHLENLIQFQDVAPMVNQIETNLFIQQKKFHEQREEKMLFMKHGPHLQKDGTASLQIQF